MKPVTQIDFQEQLFETQGRFLNYAVGDGVGTPLLCLHGVTRAWQDMLPVMTALSSRYQVFGLDFRGHGLSSKGDTSYLTLNYIRDTVTFVQERFSEPCVIFGHSLGAMVAGAVASELPERVRAVILEDPPFDTMGVGIFETSFHAYFTALHKLLLDRAETVEEMATKLADLRFPSPDGKTVVRLGDVRLPEAIRFHAECLLQLSPNVLTPIVEGRWLEGWDWRAQMARISCPTLLLVGDTASGGMLPNHMAMELVQNIPTLQRIDFQGFGHQLHATAFDRVMQSVTHFLDSL